jgi:hypothetical protein
VLIVKANCDLTAFLKCAAACRLALATATPTPACRLLAYLYWPERNLLMGARVSRRSPIETSVAAK